MKAAEGKREAITGRYQSSGRAMALQTGVAGCFAGVSCVPFPMYDVMRVMMWKVEEGRPQGGGGVDHPNKVQQINTQTDKHHSHSLYSQFPLSNRSNRRQTALNTADVLISGGFLDFYSAPGVLTTLKSNMSFMFIDYPEYMTMELNEVYEELLTIKDIDYKRNRKICV